MPIGIAGSSAIAVAAILAALVDALGRDGIRVGSWGPQPLPAGLLLVAVFLVGTLVPARPRRPAHRSLAALFAVVLGLAAVQLWRSSPAEGPVALPARLGSGGNQDAGQLTLNSLRRPARVTEAFSSPVGLDIEVDGFLSLPESGTYAFESDCGGACTLAVDGRVLLAGEGRSRTTVTLTAGVRPVRLALRQTGRRPFARFDWNRPPFLEAGRFDEAVTPTSTGRDLRGREGRAFVRCALHWLLAVAAVLLALDLSAAARGGLPAVPRAIRAWLSDDAHRAGLAAGGAALLFLAALHAWIAPRALPGGYLHAWTSEYMMQTVSVADLRDEPLRSLVFNHIQPPLFDALRAVLVAANQRASDDPGALVGAVDHGLYVCWALAFAVGAALTTTWMVRLAGRVAGVVAALFYAVHPATLFYATYLDSTFVSALGVLWVTYELWRMGPEGQGSDLRLGASVVALFLTRSIVQWPFLMVLLAALLLRGCAGRRAMRIVAALALVMGIFLAKQYALFGLSITSSFGPDSFCKGIGDYCPGITPVDLPLLPPPATASALRRAAKVNGEYNYNQLAFLRRSFSQMKEYRVRLHDIKLIDLGRRLLGNLSNWLIPSSRHSANVLVDALPWRGVFDRVMSGWVLVALILTASALWFASSWPDIRAVRAGLGLALPALYVAAVSVAFESNENMRYKFFVEPLLIVLLASQAAVIARVIPGGGAAAAPGSGARPAGRRTPWPWPG